MEKNNIIELQNKESVSETLTIRLQNGARELICNAVEAVLRGFISEKKYD